MGLNVLGPVHTGPVLASVCSTVWRLSVFETESTYFVNMHAERMCIDQCFHTSEIEYCKKSPENLASFNVGGGIFHVS